MSTLDTKLCKKCGVEQDLSCFSKNKTRADGRAAICKSCSAAYSKEYNAINKEKTAKTKATYRAKNKEKIAKQQAAYNIKNKEKIAKQQAAYNIKNKEKIAKQHAEYRIKNKEKIAEKRAAYCARNKARIAESTAEYRIKNEEKIAAQRALYRAKNRDLINATRRAYAAKKKKEDPGFRLRRNISSRLHLVLKRPYKYATTAMLGCTKTELMGHLESMFDGDMTWENYGLGGWEVDHIKPLARFDLTDEEQLKQACHYTNLQPLWAFDNRSKGAKYEETTNG